MNTIYFMEFDNTEYLINEIKKIKFPLPDDLINKIIDEYVDTRNHCGFCNDPMEWNDQCVFCNKYICEFCIGGNGDSVFIPCYLCKTHNYYRNCLNCIHGMYCINCEDKAIKIQEEDNEEE